MTTPGRETSAAWRELCDGLRALPDAFLTGHRAVDGDRAAAEGYRAALTALGIAADLYLFADRARPLFVDVATPLRRDRRWGGDNTDCWYCFTPIDPSRSYRIRGQRGDSAYFCFTVYNEPSPGTWADRIVANLNDTDIAVDAEGRFDFVIGPSRPAGYEGRFVALDEGAAIAFTRDYQLDARTGRRVTWEIGALDPPGPLDRSDADTAAALRAALRWVQMLFGIVPLALAPADPDTTLGHNTPVGANEFAEPYRVVDATYGWSARDATYSFANFVLGPDEALVITHRPPACRFWNLVVWNPFMATESPLDATTSINLGRAVANADGTVSVVVGRESLPHPNAVTTGGRGTGALAFRWFLADEVPARPTLAVVPAADAPTGPT
jgi:hypothetical protein